MKKKLLLVFLLPIMVACSGNCNKTVDKKQISRTAPLDLLMGDYQGTLTLEQGEEPLCAQVIAYKDGHYKTNILSKFDTREPALIVLDGQKQDDGSINFKEGSNIGTSWIVKITKEGLSGTVKGSKTGTFLLKKTERLSPTLGKKPPQNAAILFDGTSLKNWSQTPEPDGYVNLAKYAGGDNSCAYLKTNIWSDIAQNVMLDLGSDDGIKIWLNGTVVFALNKHRGASPGQDTVNIDLKKGWNDIFVKVPNDNGGWGAYLRLSNTNGEALNNITVSAKASKDLSVKLTKGFITNWHVSGAYKEEGKEGKELFDSVFPPESGESDAAWKEVETTQYDDAPNWEIVNNEAMQVKPGSRSIYTRQSFWNYQLHLEFRSPFMPDFTGQSRGNSGLYQLCRYEVQVLDSYGLEGKDNECGGIYKISRPLVNMCAPPMQWQTYDITFKAPKFNKKGKKMANARITVVHNGVVIHDNLELPFPTGGAFIPDETIPAGLFLQDHGDPVQYRNIWLIDLDKK